MPGRSNYKTMRYNGQFQLDRSASEQERVELTIAQPFWRLAWRPGLHPAEQVGLERAIPGTPVCHRDGYGGRMDQAGAGAPGFCGLR